MGRSVLPRRSKAEDFLPAFHVDRHLSSVFWISEVAGSRFSSSTPQPSTEAVGHSLLLFNCVRTGF